jgi:hypothetical protein
METEHRPDVAIALVQPLWIEASSAAHGASVSGYAVAVGWDRPQGTTFYLVSAAGIGRPVWVAEDAIVSNSIRPLAED